MLINCLAIDDELQSLDILADNIRRISFLHLVKCCNDAYEATEIMQKQPIDLLFLDIHLPELSGLQFLASLTHKPMVIFVTAYKNYALEGFNLDVLDYLLKPVPFERFLKSANKAAEYHAFKKQISQSGIPGGRPDYIFVNVDYSLTKIRLQDVTHIEALKDYIKIYLLGQSKPVISKMTMKALSDKLVLPDFVRVHKSFIVAIDKIEHIRKSRIVIGDHYIPISDHYKADFFNRIGQKG
jgi:DNA-binding LytR/AlgR family response regulator